MKFTKYHALGNDYLVIDPEDIGGELSVAEIKLICDRHYGVGSDGILYGPLADADADFALRIFNPDGSEAEKSGNGLRIFARYLWDQKLVNENPFSIATKGGIVKAKVGKEGRSVLVEMGLVRFTHESFASPTISAKSIRIDEMIFDFYAVHLGNPHCVILVDDLTPELAKQYGPVIELDPQFSNRTNVQFLKIIDRANIQIEIWERGAGYTFASGSSSTACAAVAYALGLCDANISVHMPGGIIDISLTDNFHASMCGAVGKIGEGVIVSEASEHY